MHYDKPCRLYLIIFLAQLLPPNPDSASQNVTVTGKVSMTDKHAVPGKATAQA